MFNSWIVKHSDNRCAAAIFILFIILPSVLFCNYYYLETTVPAGSYPYALAYNYQNQKIYCANMGSNSVTVINQVTNQIITTIRVGKSPAILIYNPTSNKIYCANQISNTISIIDGNTNYVINTISVGLRPSALICDSINNKIYCANASSNNITVIDAVNDNVITTINVGYFPSTLLYNPINNKIYCANKDNQTVTIIDGTTYQVITTIPVGVHPGSLAHNPVTNKIYCSGWANGRIHIINGVTDQLIDSIIYSNSGPQSLTYVPYNKIWYVNFTGDNIKVIDGTTNTVSATAQFSAGTRPYSLFRDNNTGIVYCANLGKNNVMVLYSSSPEIMDTLDANYPIAIITTWIPAGTRVYIASLWSMNISVYRFNFPGIEQIANWKLEIRNFSIYPNPAKTFFTVRSSLNTQGSMLRIFDVSGKMVKVQEMKDSKVQKVSLDKINPGIYFVQLGNDPLAKKLKIIQ